jgi:hypothetical protein
MEQEKSDDCKEEKMKNYTFIRKWRMQQFNACTLDVLSDLTF